MTNIEHHQDAAFLIEMLRVRQRYLRMTNADITRAVGLSHTTLTRCQRGDGQLTLKTAMAWAAALGLAIGIRDKQ